MAGSISNIAIGNLIKAEDVNAHITSTSNPHSVTASQVGLGNVENTKLSTWAGSSNITTIGTLSSGTVPWARLSGVPSSFTPSTHTHKYIELYEARSSTTTLNKSANYAAAGAMFHLIASSSTSATDNGKTPTDANVLQMNWDNNGGYDAQIAVSTGANRMYFRDQPSTKKAWQEVAHAQVGTSDIGSVTQPVYMTSTGVITACTFTSLGSSHPNYWYAYSQYFENTSVPSGDWYAEIILNRTWDANLTGIVIQATYSNRVGQFYLNMNSHDGNWSGELAVYGVTNILAIRAYQDSSSKKTVIHLKLRQPVEYNGSTPKGSLKVYSPVEISSITAISADPDVIAVRRGYNSSTSITVPNNYSSTLYSTNIWTDYIGSSSSIASRLTSINFTAGQSGTTGRTKMRLDLVTTSCTAGTPPVMKTNSNSSGYLHTYYWDTSSVAMTQLYIPNGDHITSSYGPQTMMIRGYDGSWKDWVKIPFGDGTGASGTWGISITGSADTVKGSYTLNGGQQNPNYFGKNKVGFLMMNTTVNNNSQYKDWIIMDCYVNNDVGGGVAFGVNRQSLGAYIMRSAAERSSWAESAELLGTHNYNSYVPTLTGTGASGTWGISITGNAANVTGTVTIDHGGTGATTAANARTNLGLGSMATETATNYLKWQSTSSASTALYNFGVYRASNTAAGTGPGGSNYYNLINIPYSAASGNNKPYWGWQLGNRTDNDSRLWYRTAGDNVWGDWQTIAHATTSTNNIGSATQPVYMTAAGVITPVSWYPNYATISSGNKANYPWHKFAECTTGAGQWTDKIIIVIIHSRYNEGPYGMIKLSMRTNATNAEKQTKAVWLFRYGFNVNDVVITTPTVTTGTDETISAYVKCGGYARRVAYMLEGSNVGWSLVSSNEPNDTTASDNKGGTNIFASLSGVTEAIDGASVSYANTAGSAAKATQDANGDAILDRYFKVYNTGYIGNSSSVTVNDLASYGPAYGMINSSTDNPIGSNTWVHVLSMGWGKTNASWIGQIALHTDGSTMYFRGNGNSAISGKAWNTILSSNNYSSYALPLSGGTMTGAFGTANNTWNTIGDDAYLGDINKAGHIGIKGKNGNTGLMFVTYNQDSNTTGGAITWDGTKFNITSTTAVNANISGSSGSCTGNATTATTASKLSNTSAIGSDVKPVYFTNGGVPQATATEMIRAFTTTDAGTDLNTMYNSGMYGITGGTLSNYPTGGDKYATILTVAYRKPSGNTKTDYAWQLGNFCQNNDRMWYRTSLDNSWRAWRQIVNIATNTKTGDTNAPVYIDADGSVQSCTTYANATVGTANKLSYTLATTTKYYLAGTTLTATGTSGGTFDTGIYVTTTAGQLSAKAYNINDGTNEKVRLEYNSTDQSLDFIFI